MNIIALDGLSGSGKTSNLAELVGQASQYSDKVIPLRFYGHLGWSEQQSDRRLNAEALVLLRRIFRDETVTSHKRVELFTRLLELAIVHIDRLATRSQRGLILIDRSPLTAYALAKAFIVGQRAIGKIRRLMRRCSTYSVVLLDVPPAVARYRCAERNRKRRGWAFEHMTDDQLRRARAAFLEGATMFSRSVVIDARQELPLVNSEIDAFVRQSLIRE